MSYKSKLFIFADMETHEKYMLRCLELAQKGLGYTYPNPLVGSIIVHNDVIIGEGWHVKSGKAHAEVNAINSVKDKSLLKESTIYVSLEPCNHYGKTPPCCDLIIENQIPNVVIATSDPFEEVNGSGIERLRQHGINVTVGILEKEAKKLNRRFFTFHQNERPFVILKWAQSLDGFMAPELKKEQKPIWISNTNSRQLTHKWRTEEQAILVGTKTVLDDNPQLNARDWFGNQPIRIIIDQHLKIDSTYKVYDNSVKTIFITEKVKNTELNTHFETIDFYKNIPAQILSILYKHQIQSIIVEGGSKTLQQFIERDLWDEARIFIGDVWLAAGAKAPHLNRNPSDKIKILNDTLLTFENHHHD